MPAVMLSRINFHVAAALGAKPPARQLGGDEG
jgi:hypothetical protein